MPSESDRLLIQQIRQGDPRAWDALIARYEGRLLAFVQRRLRDRAASEDVVQETFVGFLNSLPNFDDRRELQTYLFTIASHKLTDHLRRIGRHPLRSLSGGRRRSAQPATRPPPRRLQLRPQRGAAGTGERRPDALPGPDAARPGRSASDFVRLKVLELLWVKGWANRDVAAFLDISEQQVANYRFAAVKKLTEQIRDAGLSADVFPELHAPADA